MSQFRDITGKRRNRLTAVWPAGRVQTNSGTYIVWLVACDCGNMLTIPRCSFGVQVSCGCAKREALRRMPHKIKHGQSGSGAHKSWLEMKRRCLNPKTAEYKNYGGRGITVCERWMDFRNFYADMGPRPVGMSLDRIDNDGNYEAANCKWSTPAEQALNRRPKKRHVCWQPKPLTIQDVRAWAA